MERDDEMSCEPEYGWRIEDTGKDDTDIVDELKELYTDYTFTDY